MKFRVIFLVFILILFETKGANAVFMRQFQTLFRSGVLDINFFRCMIQYPRSCPNRAIHFRMYTPDLPGGIPIVSGHRIALHVASFNPKRETALLIHGFNGTETDEHIRFLRDAYVSRNYNVVTVDWKPLVAYPCYLTGLVNTRLVAQCSAQIYAFLNYNGAVREKVTCVGHSLGAHICGMISDYLTKKQYRIIGLDPAKPLIERKKNDAFRLTHDDANVVQVIHTNAGVLGMVGNPGHLNYCVNGGKLQPFCKGNPIRRSRCSHFLSVCYLASALFKHKKFLGVPCPEGCTRISGPHRLPVSSKSPFDLTSIKEFKIGNDAPDEARGIYCIDASFVKHCPFSELLQ